MLNLNQNLCLNEVEVYYSDHTLTTHGPSSLEVRISQLEKNDQPGRFEDVKVCSENLKHVRQVRACLSYLMANPLPSIESEYDQWINTVVSKLGVSVLELQDALLISANAQLVDWSRMDLTV